MKMGEASLIFVPQPFLHQNQCNVSGMEDSMVRVTLDLADFNGFSAFSKLTRGLIINDSISKLDVFNII